MSYESPGADTPTPEELSEVLADATGTEPKEIEPGDE